MSADDSTDVRDTTAAASSAIAWHDLNTRLSAHYQRAACVEIDAAVAALRRFQMHQQGDLALALDNDLIADTRGHAMAHYLECECGEVGE